MMKKLLLVATLGVAGFMSASSPVEKNVEKITSNLSVVRPPIVFQAFAAYDGPDGTCFVWGTFTLNPELGTFQFAPASQATQDTIITPPCTGEGSHLA